MYLNCNSVLRMKQICCSMGDLRLVFHHLQSFYQGKGCAVQDQRGLVDILFKHPVKKYKTWSRGP